MPNDAKLGLVVGVGLVIAVAVVFFRKEAANPDSAAGKPPPAVTPSPADPAAARPVARDSGEGTARHHTVREGDTLAGLAKQYYGDEARSAAIFQVNRTVLTSPDELPPGVELVIPTLPAAGDAPGREP